METQILLAGLIAVVIGALWYSKVLFGNLWMKLAEVSRRDARATKGTMVRSLIVQFAASVVLVYILSDMLYWYEVRTVSEGVMVGFRVWFGFFATTQLGLVLWENKSWRLYLINTVYYLVLLSVLGGLLTYWGV